MTDLLNYFISVSVVILAVILLRQIFGNRISPVLRYSLWLIVLLKLFIPVTFLNTGFSLNEMIETGTMQIYTLAESAFPSAPDSAENSPDTEVQRSDAALQSVFSGSSKIPASHTANPPASLALQIPQLFFLIWISGAIITATVFLICNLHFYRRLRRTRLAIPAEEIPLTVYLTDQIQVPCLFGFIPPAIYLTSECLTDEKRKTYILTHELVHYRQLDPLWSLLRAAAVTLYWYHPLVWAAARLTLTDSELACDWRTVRILGEENRADYGRTLIQMASGVPDRNAAFLCASGISDNITVLKKRIRVLASHTRKRRVTALFVTAVSLALFSSIFSSGAPASRLKTPDYPLSSETVTDALRECGLAWEITAEDDTRKENGVTAYTMNDRFGKIISVLTSHGNAEWQTGSAPDKHILSLNFMSVDTQTYDPLDHSQLCAPLTEADFEQVLALASLLFGGFESENQLSDAYRNEFEQNVDITAKEYAFYTGDKTLIYSETGEWVWTCEDITCQMKVGWPEGSDEMVLFSLNICNTSSEPYPDAI